MLRLNFSAKNPPLRQYPNRFKFAKFQAQIKYKQLDIAEAQKWAKVAIESAEKEGVELSKEDQILHEIAFQKGDKSNG